MTTFIPTHQQLIEEVSKLPTEALPELANFLSYLQYKVETLPSDQDVIGDKMTGSAFLLSIAGIGESAEDDLSERDEEILATEIGSIRGWGFNNVRQG